MDLPAQRWSRIQTEKCRNRLCFYQFGQSIQSLIHTHFFFAPQPRKEKGKLSGEHKPDHDEKTFNRNIPSARSNGSRAI